jgi:outer membrane receptor protein involved in Fe transport
VNQQAQAYLNRTPGKGEVGINLKSIPLAAVERIEVLRDRASSQYGSDAMAGVMNFILKEDSAFSTLSAGTGITSEGDGFQFNLDYNTTFAFGEGGRINLTVAYTDQEKTNRAGSPGLDAVSPLYDPVADPNAEDGSLANEIQFATDDPTLGMIVGRPDLQQKTIFANITHPVGDNAEFYMTHGYSERWNRSFAYYRFPGWRRDVASAGFLNTDTVGLDSDGYSDFVGYHPTFEGDIKDFFNVVVVDFDLANGWNLDLGLVGNFNETTPESIDTPTELEGVDIFAREEAGLITNSRPKSKIILTADYSTNRLEMGMYITRFGEVTVTAPAGGTDQELSAKLITDFRVTYLFTPQLSLTGIINNVFDVYPDETLASTKTAQAGTRFIYSSEVQQQGQLGRNFSLSLNYKF